MLQFNSQQTGSRRTFLKVGSLAAGGLALPQLFSLKQAAAAGSENVFRGKSVIWVYLHGGPTQIETFDPKMSAPSGVRSITGEIPTKLHGVTFGSTFKRLANLADKLAIVRSFNTAGGNHDLKPLVSGATLGGNPGALVSKVIGGNNPRTGMPTNAVLFPRAVDPQAGPEQKGFGDFTAVGPAGAAAKPFVPGSGGGLQDDMKLWLEPQRLDDRRNLLSQVDRLQRQIDSDGSIAGLDQMQQQAFQTILGGVSDAFDLGQEDPRTLARYDTAPLIDPKAISKKWNNHRHYVDNTQTLGKLLLLSRRLVERGCTFVTVTTNFVWDMHADANNATIDEGMEYCGAPLDHALSALIEDLHARGLDKDVLVVCCGEMGRTPKLNNRGGRDHWGRLAPLLLSGGGLQMGQVIGHSSRDAGEPASEPMTNERLISTIAHTLFDVGKLRLEQGVPTDINRVLSAGEPIPGLL